MGGITRSADDVYYRFELIKLGMLPFRPTCVLASKGPELDAADALFGTLPGFYRIHPGV